jgi:hypothetical protein
MAKQIIGIGAAPNDGTGDTLRDAMDKVNDNFTEVYNAAVEPTVYYFAGRTFRFRVSGTSLYIDQVITANGFDVGGVENVNWSYIYAFSLVP